MKPSLQTVSWTFLSAMVVHQHNARNSGWVSLHGSHLKMFSENLPFNLGGEKLRMIRAAIKQNCVLKYIYMCIPRKKALTWWVMWRNRNWEGCQLSSANFFVDPSLRTCKWRSRIWAGLQIYQQKALGESAATLGVFQQVEANLWAFSKPLGKFGENL